MANARLYSSWGLLTEALKTGRNQNESKESGDLFGPFMRIRRGSAAFLPR